MKPNSSGARNRATARGPVLPPEAGRAGRRFLQLLVVFTACVLLVDALAGDNGLLQTRRAREQYDQLTESVTRLRYENARLREEARRLREDPRAIEEIARGELGLIRPGELLFIVKDVPAPTPLGK